MVSAHEHEMFKNRIDIQNRCKAFSALKWYNKADDMTIKYCCTYSQSMGKYLCFDVERKEWIGYVPYDNFHIIEFYGEDCFRLSTTVCPFST